MKKYKNKNLLIIYYYYLCFIMIFSSFLNSETND